jgi:CRISPR-associated protein Cmr6
MKNKGKLIVQKDKGGYSAWVIIDGNPLSIAALYVFIDRSLNGQECEVEWDGAQISKVSVNGKELLPKRSGQASCFTGARDGVAAPVPTQAGLPNRSRYLPRDTQAHLPSVIDNFGLLLNKMVRFKDGKPVLFEKGKSFSAPDFQGICFQELADRRREALQGIGLLIKSKTMKTQWRCVIGLGGESVYETSLTLHHVYGFPYVPGSAVKGAVRSTVILECFGNDEIAASKDEGFCLIFGRGADGQTGSRQGGVHFFDAYPKTRPKIAVDIMNPHYAPYYQDTSGACPPGDYYKPIPVPFLTMENTELVFYLGIETQHNTLIGAGKLKGDKVLDQALFYLEKTSTDFGLGAKTSVGYGLMIIKN